TYLGCYIGSTATFFRKSTIIDAGHLLNTDFKYVMDGEYYARLGSLNKCFSYLPQVLADFRLHGENLSKKNYQIDDASSWLKLQTQFAESRAYRRAYGHNLFRDDNLNSLVDSLLYIYYRLVKFTL